jgi:hypothetical protein
VSAFKIRVVRQRGHDELAFTEALSIRKRSARHLDAQALGALPTLTPTQAAGWLKDSKSDFGDAVLDPWV